MAETFESMGGGVGMSSHQQLTSNPSAAFCVTLRGICGIAECLLELFVIKLMPFMTSLLTILCLLFETLTIG